MNGGEEGTGKERQDEQNRGRVKGDKKRQRGKQSRQSRQHIINAQMISRAAKMSDACFKGLTVEPLAESAKSAKARRAEAKR